MQDDIKVRHRRVVMFALLSDDEKAAYQALQDEGYNMAKLIRSLLLRAAVDKVKFVPKGEVLGA
jgi:hypothetical protein